LLTEASFAKPMLEGEGDALWFHLKCEALEANLTKGITKTKKQKPLVH
jgi:hypothetical protein